MQACNSTVVAKRLLDPQFSHVCGNAHTHTDTAVHRKSQIRDQVSLRKVGVQERIKREVQACTDAS